MLDNQFRFEREAVREFRESDVARDLVVRGYFNSFYLDILKFVAYETIDFNK